MSAGTYQSLLGAVFGVYRGREEPGGKFVGDYSEFGFRAPRAHLNSAENFGVFAFSLLLAVIVGASVAWVNWLAWLYVAARGFHRIIYYAGIGPNFNGPRSMVFGLDWMLNFLRAAVALFALFN